MARTNCAICANTKELKLVFIASVRTALFPYVTTVTIKY